MNEKQRIQVKIDELQAEMDALNKKTVKDVPSGGDLISVMGNRYNNKQERVCFNGACSQERTFLNNYLKENNLAIFTDPMDSGLVLYKNSDEIEEVK